MRVSLLPLSLLTYTEWIAPLPYNALYPVDNEPAAFYVARIQASGKAAWVHSPYSPGWWVGRVAIAVTGDGLENIETWLTLCRYLSALLLATLIVILRLDSPATMLIQRSGSGVCRNFHVADRMGLRAWILRLLFVCNHIGLASGYDWLLAAQAAIHRADRSR